MAESSFQKLKDLDLSRDEVERIGQALKQEEFRKLLVDYVEEVQNPANKKLYESEIAQLEKERGNDVTFIDPQPGYVIKTSVDGNKKCFINICCNDNIQEPSSKPAFKEGSKGLQWALPHSLTPPRDDLDNKGVRCQVFDVVFHPNTLRMSRNNQAFRNMLNNTALEAIEKNFDVKLDKNNLKFPKLQFKGLAHASMIRKPSAKNSVMEQKEPLEQEFLDKLYAQVDQSMKPIKKSPRKNNQNHQEDTIYTTPKYLIKHRSHVDIQEFVDHKEAKINAAIPKELQIEINLPLLKTSSDITLDVTEKTIQLISEKPSKYKLNLTLPYRVNQDNGNAKFDKDLKKLIITLPVKRALIENRDDSGVESDQPPSHESEDEDEEIIREHEKKINKTKPTFLDENLHYDLPEFTCHLYENVLAFTLNVKNVDSTSLKQIIEDDSIHIKFTSISSSFYNAHYAFFVKTPSKLLKEGVLIETWDNNVIIQLPCDNEIKYYYYGLKETDLNRKFIEEPSIINNVLQNPIPEETELETPTKDTKSEEQEESISSNAINILGTSYESSGDELSYSYSPSKSKGILKRLASTNRWGRSISESSLDDFCSSLDSHNPNPEDGGEAGSLKKTVRFNDVIMRQLYR